MTIQDITCFLTLAENLNYTKTAEELFISQPAVTRHINSLEDELGIMLFDRSVKRSISLTEAGKIYLKGLKKCNDIYENTLSAINNKAMENPLIINILRGISIPDEFVDETNLYMNFHPNFHHFTNFIEASALPLALENGEIIICQSEYVPKNSSLKTLCLTTNPVAHYLIAYKNHPGFIDSSNPDFNIIRSTTLFLPKDIPDSLKDKYILHLKELLESEPIEIMYLDSIDSVEHFLRSGRCFTIANGWNSLVDSKNYVSYKMDFASHYIAIWDPTKCIYPQAIDYLKKLKGLSI